MYDHGKNGVLSVTDNNHLIVKAFATAWKYRELYEKDGNVSTIAKKQNVSLMTTYRYLRLAYMRPDKINKVLSGDKTISINELFSY